MATKTRSKASRAGRFLSTAKPSGSFHPRVVAAGPEHFGIVAVDCAKARSKWMLADYYGRILVPPTEVEHTRQGLQHAIARLRQAIDTHGLRDVIVAIERTGAYHRPPQRAFAAAAFEVRIAWIKGVRNRSRTSPAFPRQSSKAASLDQGSVPDPFNPSRAASRDPTPGGPGERTGPGRWRGAVSIVEVENLPSE